ncbi:hypothetical protein SI65_06533 [Aspergillus cristatus]|uniref:Uncharacterized protein n=1 Tax=Aspergillus cristatus TaxID=573508 RepID=A0A1E3B9W1_ASPCR|nr:hypothetical protein SI65_06533 [Aspergillus cristatus]
MLLKVLSFRSFIPEANKSTSAISCVIPESQAQDIQTTFSSNLYHWIQTKMSAPNPGRQSPDPERQSGAQQRDPVSAGKTLPEFRGEPRHSQAESEDTKNTKLESNPVHRLEEIEAKKYQK